MAWLLCRCRPRIKTLDLVFLRPCHVQSCQLLVLLPHVGLSLLLLCLLFNCVEKTLYPTTLSTWHGIARPFNKSEPLALISIFFLSSALLLQLAKSFLPLQLILVCLSPLFCIPYAQQNAAPVWWGILRMYHTQWCQVTKTQKVTVQSFQNVPFQL